MPLSDKISHIPDIISDEEDTEWKSRQSVKAMSADFIEAKTKKKRRKRKR